MTQLQLYLAIITLVPPELAFTDQASLGRPTLSGLVPNFTPTALGGRCSCPHDLWQTISWQPISILLSSTVVRFLTHLAQGHPEESLCLLAFLAAVHDHKATFQPPRYEWMCHVQTIRNFLNNWHKHLGPFSLPPSSLLEGIKT